MDVLAECAQTVRFSASFQNPKNIYCNKWEAWKYVKFRFPAYNFSIKLLCITLLANMWQFVAFTLNWRLSQQHKVSSSISIQERFTWNVKFLSKAQKAE